MSDSTVNGHESGTESVKFKAQLDGGVQAVFKADDGDGERFIIWGKASVEVVDKEGDKIEAGALKDALPQLLRRSRLSVDHSDQLVGNILENFETDEPVTVEIDGKEYTRDEFPTDVLELDEDEPPALFVCGEVWEDTKQARDARDKIERGEFDSYSISGEAIQNSTRVKDGDVFDEISELDLSAVTLCEEGMNQKAKFGTVVKMGDSDDRSPQGDEARSPGVAVLKSGTDETMSDSTDGESDNGEGELLTREDLHGEFKNAAQEALSEADFATKDDVQTMIDERLEREGEAVTSDEGGEATHGGARDDDEEEDDEDEIEAEDDDDEEDEVEVPVDDDEDDDYDEKSIADLAEKHGVSPGDIVEAVKAEFEVDEEDEDDDVEIDDVEVDEVDVEDPDDKAGTWTNEDLQAELPDDLWDAVSEYLTEEEVGDPEPAEEEIELEDEDEEPVSEESLEGDIGKMDDEEYLVTTSTGSTPSIDEVAKSFQQDSDENDDSETVDGVKTKSDPLDAFYESVGEEPTAN